MSRNRTKTVPTPEPFKSLGYTMVEIEENKVG